jgi:hypothetical protein
MFWVPFWAKRKRAIALRLAKASDGRAAAAS